MAVASAADGTLRFCTQGGAADKRKTRRGERERPQRLGTRPPAGLAVRIRSRVRGRGSGRVVSGGIRPGTDGAGAARSRLPVESGHKGWTGGGCPGVAMGAGGSYTPSGSAPASAKHCAGGCAASAEVPAHAQARGSGRAIAAQRDGLAPARFRAGGRTGVVPRLRFCAAAVYVPRVACRAGCQKSPLRGVRAAAAGAPRHTGLRPTRACG